MAAGRALYEEACDLARRINNPERLASALNNLGEIERAAGHHTAARERYREALQLQREVGNPSAEAMTLLNLGWIALELNDWAEAEQTFGEVLRRSTQLQAWPQTLEVIAGLADLRARQGDVAMALAWLGAVRQHPAYDAQHEEVIAPLLERLRQAMSVEELEAGLARGRELPLTEVIDRLLVTNDPV